ncbi:hypothetical protein [Methylocapsa palsarum]|uniref:hypothetical protein n=1 Tax=Methylocapsa palsarum TaxID=1612308 RepID=UPI001113E123|nr:hypothetical protein [Methylocapsa palsarum]
MTTSTDLRNSQRRTMVRAAALGLFLGSGFCAFAQSPPKPPDSPLDTIMKTRLWADVPEAKDFVRQTRPPSDALEYQPTHGVAPERPALRTKSELEAMQAELEGTRSHNQAKASQRKRVNPAPVAEARKAAPTKAMAN